MYWYDEKGAEKDVFVSSRIRLARNLCDYPFEPTLSVSGRTEITEKLKNVYKDYNFTDFSKIGRSERISLAEKNLISPEFAESTTAPGILVSEDFNTSIMICEEDHVRIQTIKSGFDLEGAAKAAFAADSLIDDKLNIAFDEKLGYLTHCPTNLGTGMRASVMMFLPALTMTGKIKGLSHTLEKWGVTVRGMQGEGSAVKGCLYQLSNTVSMGMTEEEIIDNLKEAVRKIAESERSLRKDLSDQNGDKLKDKIMRSYGEMKYAYLCDTEDLYRLYSDVRLGISLGMIKGITEQEIDYLMVNCMPASITVSENKNMTARERDKVRAERINSALK